MLVFVVVATLPDNSAMDVDRMNKVEDLHPEVARAMLNSGTAREPTEAEIAAYRGEHPESVDPDAPVDGPRPVADEPYVNVPAKPFDNGGDLPPGQIPAEKARPRKGEPTEAPAE